MVLFNIPDIRLFWSKDLRFKEQFVSKPGQFLHFQQFSKYPPSARDISFWADPLKFSENDFCDLARNCGRDLVESVELV